MKSTECQKCSGHHSMGWRPVRRGERGLTTLEWLLIVAAVAGLAALAVVLVQNVVDDTAEEISGNNARITAARVAAREITEEGGDKAESSCNRVNITYSDVFPDADQEAHWKDPDCKIVALDDYLAGLDATTCPAHNSQSSKFGGVKVKWDSGKCVRDA